MSTPVVEQIAVVLFSRLEKLTKTYDVTTDLAAAVRPTREGGFTPRDKQIVLSEGDDDIDEALSHPGNPPATARVQTFNIKLHAMPSEKDPTAIGKFLSVMKADVVQAVCSPANWEKFGNLAINARWGNTQQLELNGGMAGVNMPMLVTYRTDEGNPYKVRA